jgi:hypothetical protein
LGMRKDVHEKKQFGIVERIHAIRSVTLDR